MGHQAWRGGCDLCWVGTEDSADGAEVVGSQVHERAASEMVVESDVVGREEAGCDCCDGIGGLDVVGVEKRQEGVPSWVELVVACFKDDWSVGRGQDRVPKERACFFTIRCSRLFEEHMFASFEGFQSPFVVQSVGERIVDTV
jgi:hypothetical protein